VGASLLAIRAAAHHPNHPFGSTTSTTG